MSHLPPKDTQFSGTEKFTNVTTKAGGAVDLTLSSTVTAPTITVGSSTQKVVNEAALQTYLAGAYASQAYVDNAVQGLDAKASVLCATTGAETYTIASGAVTQITGTAVDGQSPAINDRIAIMHAPAASGAGAGSGTAATSQPANGIYKVTGNTTNLTLIRAVDMDTWAEVPSAYTWVEKGTLNADSGWIVTTDQGGTLGTTAVTWSLFSNASVITAGNGLVKTGSSIAVNFGTGIVNTGGATAIDTTVVPRLAVNNIFTGTALDLLPAAGQAVLGVHGSASNGASLSVDSAVTGAAAAINFMVAGVAKATIKLQSGTLTIGDNAGTYPALVSGTTAPGNVAVGNATGTLTSSAARPATGDFSTNIPDTGFVQRESRARNFSLVAAGSFPLTIATSNGLPTSEVIVCQQTSAAAITLPAASAVPAGTLIRIKDGSTAGAATNNITITRAGSDTIDGLTSFVIDTNLQSVTLCSNGSNAWWLV